MLEKELDHRGSVEKELDHRGSGMKNSIWMWLSLALCGILVVLCLVLVLRLYIISDNVGSNNEVSNEGGGLSYMYDKKNDGYVVCGIGQYDQPDIVIPKYYKGKPVVAIGANAFSTGFGSQSSLITSISIPDTVTSIGDSAFVGCTGLTSIVIPDSVTSIGDLAFSSCAGLTSIVIPDSVTSIGDSVFYAWSDLTSIYCEAEKKPEGWSDSWKYSCSAEVVWGYQP